MYTLIHLYYYACYLFMLLLFLFFFICILLIIQRFFGSVSNPLRNMSFVFGPIQSWIITCTVKRACLYSSVPTCKETMRTKENQNLKHIIIGCLACGFVLRLPKFDRMTRLLIVFPREGMFWYGGIFYR